MTVQEFSDQFDVLFNNITSNQAPGLNEYEKSVFLTKSQKEIVKNYFSPKNNPKQEGFDDNPKRQADFAKLIRTVYPNSIADAPSFDARAKSYVVPDDVFIELNAQLYDAGVPVTVLPISYGEYNRVMSKPYKYPPKYQAWRLVTENANSGEALRRKGNDTYSSSNGTFTLSVETSNIKTVHLLVKAAGEDGKDEEPSVTSDDKDLYITCWVYSSLRNYINTYNERFIRIGIQVLNFSGEGTVPDPSTLPQGTTLFNIIMYAPSLVIHEIIGKFTVDTPEYRIRYVKMPRPIILTDLDAIQNGLSIQGETHEMTSELSEELHEEILQRAVELAKIAWQGDVKTSVEAGQRSE